MKANIFFLSLFILAKFSLEAQNVVIPDPLFKSYLLGISNINTNGDNEIQLSEAYAYSGTINCLGMDIQDITGIEAFINLRELNCSYNYISSLDVSNLTKLEILICNHNSIPEINVSNNPLLKELWVYENELTEIDVTNNLELWRINVRNNYITHIDISINRRVSEIACENNLLTYLNIRNGNNKLINYFFAYNNPNLNCIIVDSPHYSYTNWLTPTTYFNYDSHAHFHEDCGYTSIETNEYLPLITLYPNPTSSIIYFSEKTNIHLTDAMGKLIDRRIGVNYYDFSNFHSGLYFFTLINNEGTIIQRNKVVKK